MNDTRRKRIQPVLASIGALLLAVLITYPMMSMEVKAIPIGIISVDKGVQTPAGNVNAGNEIVKSISNAGNGVISWETAQSEKKLEQNFSDGDYYAMLTIAEDFSSKAMNGEDKTIQVTINQGKNPIVFMQMSNMLGAISETAGLTLETEYVNETNSLGFKALFLPLICILITFVASIITAFITTKSIFLERNGSSYAIQLAYLTAGSFLIGYGTAGIISVIMDVDLEIGVTGLFLTTISLALMLLANGALNLLGRRGIAVPVILFVLGMALINLPYEFLPEWWQVLIASWEPFRYFGEGIREVVFGSAGVWNSASVAAIAVAAVGVMFSISAIVRMKPDKTYGQSGDR